MAFIFVFEVWRAEAKKIKAQRLKLVFGRVVFTI
jgi:hypothetical protein